MDRLGKVYEHGTQTHPQHLVPHPSSTFPRPPGPHKGSQTCSEVGVLLPCPAAHSYPALSQSQAEWAVPFPTVLLLGHGLLFFFKADFQVITINQAMCQVPHRPPCLPQVRRNVGTCTLNTPLDVLGPVEAGRPWEGGEGKWGSTLLRGQGEGDREGHSWREDQEGGHLKCK